MGELDRTPADVDPCVFCGREEARHRARTALWATVGIAGGLTLYGGLGYGVWRLFRLLVG